MQRQGVEEEEEEEPTCRICASGNEEAGREPMLTPCRCRGSLAFVHRGCLDEWRRAGLSPRQMTHCGICGFAYEFEPPAAGARAWGLCVTVGYELLRMAGAALLAVLVAGALFKHSERLHVALDCAPPFADEPPAAHVRFHLLCGAAACLVALGAAGLVYGVVLWCRTPDPDPLPRNHPYYASRTSLDLCCDSLCRPQRDCRCNSNNGDKGGKDCCSVCVVLLLVLGVFVAVYLVFYGLVGAVRRHNAVVRRDWVATHRVRSIHHHD